MPVTVKVSVRRLLLGAVIVSAELVEAGFGENEELKPLGSPLTLSVTEPVKPFVRLTVTV